mmetsp:Transcript_20088/g.37791  ORF Transcript_20088/g.37791 Transcript_20088/m.37791 type:complete len:236 (+) Transcript_20088:788-1495(+)
MEPSCFSLKHLSARPDAMNHEAVARGPMVLPTIATTMNTLRIPFPLSPPPLSYTSGRVTKAATDPRRRMVFRIPLHVGHKPSGSIWGRKPSGIISTASYTVPTMPRPNKRVAKLPFATPTPVMAFPMTLIHAQQWKMASGDTPQTLESSPRAKGTMADGVKYTAVINPYRLGVTARSGSRAICSSTVPGASRQKWFALKINETTRAQTRPFRDLEEDIVAMVGILCLGSLSSATS